MSNTVYQASTGWDTAPFFTDVEQGGHKPLQPLRSEDISPDPDLRRIHDVMEPWKGYFDRHMETSIPDYRNLSLNKAYSLLQQPGGRLLDIGGGTGAWNKALSHLSDGRWQTDNLEPNPDLNQRFNEHPVSGARIIPEAFMGDYGDYPRHVASAPYDVVHESMGLQFIGPDKEGQTAEVRRMLKPGGLYITDQKFRGPDWDENERVKDEWKRNYYTPEQLYEKNKEVGFQGDDEGAMVSNLWDKDDYHNLLKQNFRHVVPYWKSGNFAGFAASDDPAQVDRFVGGLKQPPRTAHRRANILDPIHPDLPPKVWDNPASPEPTFKPQHRDWLMGTALEIFRNGGYEGIENHLLFVITGSITTYQYSERSDVDTSLFVEFEAFPEWSRAEMIGLMVENLDSLKLPGTPYDLQLFIQPSAIKPADIFKRGLRAGYNLNSETWISPPDRSRVHDIEREMHDTYTYALESADKMDRLITFEPHKAAVFWGQLHRRRARDQREGKGDFSPSNIAYKMIVNRGLTTKLEDIIGQRIVL
jgi:SAM-dependent methyltransferase